MIFLSREPPFNFLKLFPHRKKSDFDRRKWFFPILCPCLWASSYRSCPSNMCSSYFYTLWDVSSLFLCSEFFLQLIFYEVAIHVHTLGNIWCFIWSFSIFQAVYFLTKDTFSVWRLLISPVNSSFIWFYSPNFLDALWWGWGGRLFLLP